MKKEEAYEEYNYYIEKKKEKTKLLVKRGKVSAGCRGLSTDSCFVFFHSQIQEEIDEPLPPVSSPHLHTHRNK